MDIFIAVNSRAFEYFVRGLVKPPMSLGLILNNLKTTLRREVRGNRYANDEKGAGYLRVLLRKYTDDVGLLRQRLWEANVPGHLRVSLLMAQIARFSYEPQAQKPQEFLQRTSEDVSTTLAQLGLDEPTGEELRRALREYEFAILATAEKVLSALRDEPNGN
jgi:hypothetical protein